MCCCSRLRLRPCVGDVWKGLRPYAVAGLLEPCRACPAQGHVLLEECAAQDRGAALEGLQDVAVCRVHVGLEEGPALGVREGVWLGVAVCACWLAVAGCHVEVPWVDAAGAQSLHHVEEVSYGVAGQFLQGLCLALATGVCVPAEVHPADQGVEGADVPHEGRGVDLRGQLACEVEDFGVHQVWAGVGRRLRPGWAPRGEPALHHEAGCAWLGAGCA